MFCKWIPGGPWRACLGLGCFTSPRTASRLPTPLSLVTQALPNTPLRPHPEVAPLSAKSSHWTVLAGEGCKLPCTPVGAWAWQGRAGHGVSVSWAGSTGAITALLPGPLCVLWLPLVPDPGTQPRTPSVECHPTVTDWSGEHGKVEIDSPVPTQVSPWGHKLVSSVAQLCPTLRPHESQHARPPCPSPTPGVHSDSHPSSQWHHPAISSSVIPFSSCPKSLPASESFPMSQLFAWGGQSIGVSALASVLPMNTPGWSPLGWTGWISLQWGHKTLYSAFKERLNTWSSEDFYPTFTSCTDVRVGP